ncbi:uncharacterized protein LOC134209530 [Armigeres subalbatus]|uniref:uncharacterized protein LOC134209530 n=1 Tax=Armigeres subalbatus TaxID=124917 RepID=UPI002ED5DFBB
MVYLEPVDFDQPTQQHPVDVGKCLKQNNVTGYQDIQAIGKFRYRVTFPSDQEARKLAEISLQNHNLKCYVPVMLKQTVGLIKGVPFKYEDRELLEELEAEVPIIKVERVLKMDSEKNLTKTKNVRLTFKGKELPKTVAIYGYRFEVELYLFPIKQCQNCWGYGHKASNCKRTKKCNLCGIQHDTSEEQCRTKCINCRGNHAANSKDCPERHKQRLIAQKMQREKVSYKEARSSFLQNRFQLLEEFPGLQAEDNRSVAETSTTTRRAWRPKRDQTNRRNNNKPKSSKEAEGQSRTERSGLEENPCKSTKRENFMRDIRAFWRNVGLVGKLKKLQDAIREDVYNKQSDRSYEELIIRTSTVIEDIITEFVNNMATDEENSRKSTEEDSQDNGE